MENNFCNLLCLFHSNLLCFVKYYKTFYLKKLGKTFYKMHSGSFLPHPVASCKSEQVVQWQEQLVSAFKSSNHQNWQL